MNVKIRIYSLKAKNQKHIRPPPPPYTHTFSRQYLYESSMSGEYFGRLIATGEWGVCLLSSCKVRYPQNNLFLKFR